MDQITKFMKDILWTVIQHTVVNFPTADYAGFVPNMPTKLYDNPPYNDVLHMLPGGAHASVSKT